MKIAIHHRLGSFSELWIDYCKKNGIDFKLVNAYQGDIISQISDCNVFMWHFYQGDYRDMQFAKALILSLEQRGMKVFPDSNTCWHFDNKVWQKYLLESIGAPFVNSYVFYTREEALEWAKQAHYPVVFKLKGGAGSSNVKLVKTLKHANKLIYQAFDKGFPQYDAYSHFKEAIRRYKSGIGTIREICRPLYYKFKKYPTVFSHFHGNEIGYVYFQDFIPNNCYDIRICVVGDKAFGIKRLVRKNDFRASGSGNIVYLKEEIDENCVKIAFEVNKKLKMQSVGFDFVFGTNDEPLIVEVSYAYAYKAYLKCTGYWSSDMVWHPGENFDFTGWMIENLIKKEQ